MTGEEKLDKILEKVNSIDKRLTVATAEQQKDIDMLKGVYKWQVTMVSGCIVSVVGIVLKIFFG